MHESSGCFCPYCAYNLGSPIITFAEDNLCGWVAQPANTWSNISYLLVACLILFEINKQRSNRALLGFPFVLAIIGLSSFFYHASATFMGQFFDFASIYVLNAYLLFLALYKRNIFPKNVLILGITILTILLCAILWFLPALRIWLFAGQLFVYLALEFTQSKEKKKLIDYTPLYRSLGVFLFAWGIWWLDILYIWNNTVTMHWINGHAVWHVLTAISIYLLYRFYKKQLTHK